MSGIFFCRRQWLSQGQTACREGLGYSALFSLLAGLIGSPLASQGSAPTIPSARKLIGHEVGEAFTPHYRIVSALEAWAAASDRLQLVSYGETYEGRPLLLAVLSSPANLERLKEIQASIRQLTSKGLAEQEAMRLTRELPGIAWLSFGIHGDEASSSEAALAVLEKLLRGSDPETISLLEGLVVIVDPVLNPDGRARYVSWYEQSVGRTPVGDPSTVEHREPWPGGRTNHYLADLNRDWAWQVQRESRARAAAYLSWLPQVHVDFHEFSHRATYFFFPATQPVLPFLSQATRDWAHRFGEANAEAFDQKGWLYYTGETFDLFYPGYGDSWPTLLGAIGMTYEQAGGGQAGLVVERTTGEPLRLAERVAHHLLTAWTTLRTARANREELLMDFYRFHRPGSPSRTYLLLPSTPSTALARTLAAQGLELEVSSREGRGRALEDYWGHRWRERQIPAGAILIRSDQARGHLARSVLDREVTLSDTFFYDITAWSLPLAYGAPVLWTDRRIDLESVPWSEGDRRGEQTGEGEYALVVPYQGPETSALGLRLLSRGRRPRLLLRSVRQKQEEYRRGSLVLFPGQEGLSAGELEEEIRDSIGPGWIEVRRASTGLIGEGGDLGGPGVAPLVPVRIAVGTGPPVVPEAVGEVWHLLDQRAQIEMSLLPVPEWREWNLVQYDVLVLPDDGRQGRGYHEDFGEEGAERLRGWLALGGVLIGIEGGAAYAAKERGHLTDVSLNEPAQDSVLADLGWTERERARTLRTIPGTIIASRVDTTHPLTVGYGDTLAFFLREPLRFEPPDSAYRVVRIGRSGRLSGYLSEQDEAALENLPLLLDVPAGRGRLVLFADDPLFRGFWRATETLFLNALLLGPRLRELEP